MKLTGVIVVVTISLTLLQRVSGQGFVNLDFEDANVPPTPAGTLGGFVNPTLAFPGWTVLPNALGFATSSFYNDFSLGGPAITLIGPDFPNAPGYSPLEGCYSVLFQYFGDEGNPPALSQTAVIPAGAQSIRFLGEGNAVVSLNGVNLPLVSPGEVNIPPGLAGTSAQLTFSTMSAPGPGIEESLYLDDVQFLIVPEPSGFALLALGASLLAFRRWRPLPG